MKGTCHLMCNGQSQNNVFLYKEIGLPLEASQSEHFPRDLVAQGDRLPPLSRRRPPRVALQRIPMTIRTAPPECQRRAKRSANGAVVSPSACAPTADGWRDASSHRTWRIRVDDPHDRYSAWNDFASIGGTKGDLLEHLREAINVAVTKAPDAWRSEGGRVNSSGNLHYDDLLAPMPAALVPLRLRVSAGDEEAHEALVHLQSPRALDDAQYDLALGTVRRLLEAGACEYPFLRGVMERVDQTRGRPCGRKAHRLAWAETMLACIRLNDLFEAHAEGCLSRPLLLRAVHHSLEHDAVREGVLTFASMTCLAKKHLAKPETPRTAHAEPDALRIALRALDASDSKRARKIVLVGDASDVSDASGDEDDVPLSTLYSQGVLGTS